MRGFGVQTIRYDRNRVGGESPDGKRPEFIESRGKAQNFDHTSAFGSLMAELRLLSDADAFVGTAKSWVSRLVFLMISGRKSAIPPFIWLDQPFGCLNTHCSRDLVHNWPKSIM
jgi:hypothetical protein